MDIGLPPYAEISISKLKSMDEVAFLQFLEGIDVHVNSLQLENQKLDASKKLIVKERDKYWSLIREAVMSSTTVIEREL